MFEYKTRTELENGCRFIEQDILLFDYLYSGDCLVECTIDYEKSGFGFVIVENDNEETENKNDNIFILKFGKNNQYQIIHKQIGSQNIIEDGFINAGKILSTPIKDLRLSFKYTEDYKLQVYSLEKDDNEDINEILLMQYEMAHIMKNYKIGFYSAAGNTIKKALIKSEAPSNWISNIYNTNGGRINWIENGFQIENCEEYCEVESSNIELDAGKYYLNFETDNKDIKYYIIRVTDINDSGDLVLEERDKNILNYEDNSFELNEPGFVNLKFEGSTGTVKNICIKTNKSDKFVATDYTNIKREGSSLIFDISNDRIKKIELIGTILEVPIAENNKPQYSIISLGNVNLTLEELEKIKIGQKHKFVFDKDTGILSIDTKEYDKLQDAAKTYTKLKMLDNVEAEIDSLIVTYADGETVDVMIQKTVKLSVNNQITTPIIVTDKDGAPYNLSSSYREIVEKNTSIEIFNKYTPVNLKNTLCLNDSDIIVGGINNSVFISDYDDIRNIPDIELISYIHYSVNYENNTIRFNNNINEKYKYIVVQYSNCDSYDYEFTNYSREVFGTNEDQNSYLEHNICDVVGAITTYGIHKDSYFNKDFIYRVPNKSLINSIDYCANRYDILKNDQYSITNTLKLIIEDDVRSKYSYIVIDYLKDNSYAINERNGYYEIDIATTETAYEVLYDSVDNTSYRYKELKIDSNNIEQNNFIVLKKKEE